MGVSSKYYNNQLRPNKHSAPGAVMSQDWIAGVELQP